MQRLRKYIEYVRDDKAVVFLGAGISAMAGCDVLNTIEKKIKERIFKDEDQSLTFQQLYAYAKDKNENQLSGILREAISREPEKYNNVYIPFIRKISLIKSNLSIITTNYDSCIIETNVFPDHFSKIYYKDVDMKFDNIVNGGIFHLHGYIEDIAHIVIEDIGYEGRYTDEFKIFLNKLFLNYSVLFIGCSLKDQGILTELQKVKKNNQAKTKHFSLMMKDEKRNIAESYRELYNIEIINYENEKDLIEKTNCWINENFEQKTISKDNQLLNLLSSEEY